jgi:hypothetical protein
VRPSLLVQALLNLPPRARLANAVQNAAEARAAHVVSVLRETEHVVVSAPRAVVHLASEGHVSRVRDPVRREHLAVHAHRGRDSRGQHSLPKCSSLRHRHHLLLSRKHSPKARRASRGERSHVTGTIEN